MATLRQRDNGVWYLDYYVNGKRVQKSTGTRDRKLAEFKLKEIELGLFRGNLDEGDKPKQNKGATVREMFIRFEQHVQQNWSDQNRRIELRVVYRIRRYLAQHSIIDARDINAAFLNDYIAAELPGRKPKTIRNHVKLLQNMMNRAVEWGLIETNPIAKYKTPKVVTRFHFFSTDEIQTIISESSEPLTSAVRILVNTGIRRGELYYVRWRDVDLRAKQLRVWPYDGFTPKGKRPRTIPLNTDAVSAFKSQDRTTPDSPAFRPYREPDTLSMKFHRLVASLGFSGRLHDLRHTFASHLAMSGTPIPVIQELLGHSNINTTMIYAHLLPEQHSKAVGGLRFGGNK